MAIPINPPIVACLSAILGAGAGFVAGVFVRQPEINKLQKQVKDLQSQIVVLQETADRQNEEIATLLVELKSLKVYQLIKKWEIKGEIQDKLLLQYASMDYLQMVFACAKGEYEMTDEDVRFYNTYNRLLAEKDLPEEKRTIIQSYVMTRHASDISSLKQCDSQSIIDEIRRYDTKPDKHRKKRLFPFGRKNNEDEGSETS